MIEPVRDRRTFVALRAEGIRVRRGPLSLVFLDEGPTGVTRIAYAVGKRVGPAVVRNRARRRLRAIFAAIDRDAPGLLPSGALLVGVGPGLERRSPVELRSDVEATLEHLAERSAR